MTHHPAVDLGGLVEENRQVLDQLCDFLEGLAPEAYASPLGGNTAQSLGKHVRHIIDHYDALLAAVPGGRLDYEHRRREARLECSPREARRRLRGIATALEALGTRPGDTALTLDYPLDGGRRRCLATGLGRELAFLTSHTVHHMALLGLLAEGLGLTLPEPLGIHPSTRRHREEQARCQQRQRA